MLWVWLVGAVSRSGWNLWVWLAGGGCGSNPGGDGLAQRD